MEDRNLTECGTKTLNAAYFGVSDLTGLEHLTELKRLHLYSNNEIEDITPLANLKKLIHLNLSDNKIKDVTSLSGLTQIQTLFLNIMLYHILLDCGTSVWRHYVKNFNES